MHPQLRLNVNHIVQELVLKRSFKRSLHHRKSHSSVTVVNILGIETSCDDTGIAIVNSRGQILANEVERQNKAHGEIKGIIPIVARDCHTEAINDLVDKAMENAMLSWSDISAIAVTRGPGLSVCLDVGVTQAKRLSMRYGLPLLPVNHMEAHALVVRMVENIQYPFLALLVSGGHSLLVVCRGLGDYIQLGTTLDDAIGEAYDKVGRMLNLPWDGGIGKAVEEIALKGSRKYEFPVPMKSIKTCNFSFAGLKSCINDILVEEPSLINDPENVSAIARAFQSAAVSHVTDRVVRALEWCQKHLPVTGLVVSGGVACNQYLRKELDNAVSSFDIPCVVPPPHLCTDNGVMISWIGVESYLKGFIHESIKDHDLKSMLVGKQFYEPERAHELSYDPRWQLDPVLTDYFPGKHPKNPLFSKDASVETEYQECLQLINSGKVENKKFIKTIRSLCRVWRMDDAQNIRDKGLLITPNNEHLQQIQDLITSKRQTQELDKLRRGDSEDV